MIKEVYYWDYFNSLLKGDKHHCKEIVVSLLEGGTDIKEIYIELLQKSLYKIGKMWEDGKSSIAEEHIASKITEYLIDISLQNSTPSEPTGKKMLLTCIDKEFHDLGARMVVNLFELNGWDTVFPGANTPKKEVLDMIEIFNPDVVGISFSLYINYIRFFELLESIKLKFPDKPVLIGGQGLANDMSNKLSNYPNAKYVRSLDELEEYINSYK